ncbi:MAG: hypothetical protein WC700_08825 [Gemmatimonadaceae bacterium]
MPRHPRKLALVLGPIFSPAQLSNPEDHQDGKSNGTRDGIRRHRVIP